MNTISIATLVSPKNIGQTLLLFESLRRFGGRYANAPLIVLTPLHSGELTQESRQKLLGLDAALQVFDVPQEMQQFPLAAVAYGAAFAEAQSAAKGGVLVWMLPNTLVLNPPEPFELPDGVDFAYRPVHHTLVGSLYGQPPDAFWAAIYKHCGVGEERLFPMQTCLRDHVIRPYFNAGLLVVRPGLRLLRVWAEQFNKLARHADFEPFYQKDQRYAIFMHQAVLSAVLPAVLERRQMLELPENMNYPLHLHAEYPAAHRPERLDDLVTCRYESFDDLRKARIEMPASEAYKGWLEEKVEAWA